MGRPAGAFRRDPEPHGPHRENAIRLSEQRRDARALKQGGDVELELRVAREWVGVRARQRGAPGRAPRARACRQAAHGVSPGRTRRCSASGNNLEAQLLDGCEACNGVTPHTLRGKAKAPDRCGACVAFYMRLLNFRLSLIPKMNGLDVRSARSNISSAMLITKATTL